MAKPVILTVDDDPEVLQAVTRDLRQEYGDRFRVLRAESGAVALTALEQLKLRNQTVALFLVDQRMPQMSGVEFLEQALPMFPNAKRALLTAYADTDAAIRAIKLVASPYRLCYRDAAAGRGPVPYPEVHAWGRPKFECLGCVL